MKYPSTWSVNETDIMPEDRVDLIAEFASPLETFNDTYSEYVQLNRDDGIFYQADLNNYLQEAISAYRDTANNFTLIDSSTSDSLSGQPAYSLTFTQVLSGEASQEPITLKSFETGTLLNNTAYYITYIGPEEQFDKYFPIVKQMTDSFKILLHAPDNISLTTLATPLSSNLSTSTPGNEDLIIGNNETISTSLGSNLSDSMVITPSNSINSPFGQKNNTDDSALNGGEANSSTINQFKESSQVINTRDNENASSLTTPSSTEEKQELPLLESENKPLKKDKTFDIQIKTTEFNGIETVSYLPREIVIDIGTVVVWTNNHSSVHTVTSVSNNTFGNTAIKIGTGGSPLFDSDYMNTGDKFSYNFTQPGRFDYFDKNSDDLKGTVFVKQAPIQINDTLSLLNNEKAVPNSTISFSKNVSGSLNNSESSITGNIIDPSNSSAKSNAGTLSHLVQSLRQIIER